MKKLLIPLLLLLCACGNTTRQTTVQTHGDEIVSISGSRKISGVYPHLTTYAHSRENGVYGYGSECGIGAIAVWGGKLYMINYAAHQPQGSEHKLYIVDKDKNMSVYEGSVGGTPAARMIHRESEQLLIGHYLIDRNGNIRTIPIERMPGRLTAIARHLTDPVNKVYYYDMEGMLYEADVNTLEVTKLYNNPLPGAHSKGGYTAQGRLVLANNGENRRESTAEWQVPVEGQIGAELNGCLAEYDGYEFRIIERRQYTDVTTRHGINAVADDNSALWSMGWDKRSVRLKVLDDGKWHTYLLPKATYNNDPAHGYFTEWPRIREIGGGEMMMDMHGMFYDFPAGFSSSDASGIRPIGSHLRYVPDFCSWNGEIVIATDESSIQGNPLTGQPQSNLWFGTKQDLRTWGPASGYGAIWLKDKVIKGQPSDPYLFAGFDNRMAHIVNHGETPVSITMQLDADGKGNWADFRSFTIPAGGYENYIFPHDAKGEWLRVVTAGDAAMTVALHYTSAYPNAVTDAVFDAIADIDGTEKVLGAKLFTNRTNFNMSCYASTIADGRHTSAGEYEFRKYSFDFVKGITDTLSKEALHTKVHYFLHGQFDPKRVPADQMKDLWSEDEASVILHTSKGNLRLPKGNHLHSRYRDIRAAREVESERELANIHGTFYELPLSLIGKEPDFSMLRPVASHNKLIDDFNTWNGLLVLSGLKESAVSSDRVYKNEEGSAALWFGGIDDIWKLGKPVGQGGPWYKTAVAKGEVSDPYLMTGYDRKTLTLEADRDVTVTLLLSIAHYLDEPVEYKAFDLKAGMPILYEFPEGFSAHWAYLTADRDCTATAQFTYK